MRDVVISARIWDQVAPEVASAAPDARCTVTHDRTCTAFNKCCLHPCLFQAAVQVGHDLVL
jgi:hypothetical protein